MLPRFGVSSLSRNPFGIKVGAIIFMGTAPPFYSKYIPLLECTMLFTSQNCRGEGEVAISASPNPRQVHASMLIRDNKVPDQKKRPLYEARRCGYAHPLHPA